MRWRSCSTTSRIPPPTPRYRDAWRKLVPILVELTAKEDPRARHAAILLLGMLGPEAGEALPALRSLAHDSSDAGVRSAAEEAIESIACIDALKAKDAAVRIAAAETLGRLDWTAAAGIPALITALTDPETKVRIVAASALGAHAKLSGAAVTPLATALQRRGRCRRSRRDRGSAGGDCPGNSTHPRRSLEVTS